VGVVDCLIKMAGADVNSKSNVHNYVLCFNTVNLNNCMCRGIQYYMLQVPVGV
jgi:hypothetical protein